jgi:hypothetical protein
MIEAHDVVLDCSQESGYRLCYDMDKDHPENAHNDSASSSSKKIYSAMWDVNVNNRMFICRQDRL